MTLRMGDIEFDHVDYDAAGDVLYLSVGEARPAADYDATPGGHHVRYDDEGKIIGVTVVNAKWLLERQDEIDTPAPLDREQLMRAISS